MSDNTYNSPYPSERYYRKYGRLRTEPIPKEPKKQEYKNIEDFIKKDKNG